ncbi:MAG TPA: diacylglycerol kinase family protein [Terriglobales bacterium]
MQKAALLYNPLSGRRRERRLVDVEAAAAALRSAGVEVSATATRGASDALEQARKAVAEGCDTIFACGGDGTVHDVVQGMAGSSASLGIIPLGTANALAHDLGWPLHPAGAARAALSARPRRIALGEITYRDFSAAPAKRYFVAAAGAGVDAHLFYELSPLAKRSMGMLSYYAKATHLWLTHKMENFSVEFEAPGGSKARYEDVSQLLAVRIRNFGGVLQELAPGADLGRDHLRLVLFRTRSRLAYLRFVTRCFLRGQGNVRGIELADSVGVACESTQNSRIFVEADGELLGTLPAQISVVPNALTLLAPAR